MKKIFIVSLALVMLVLSGCGSTASTAQPTTPDPVSQTTAPESTTEPAPAPTPAPKETPAPVPTEEPIETYTIDFAGLQLKYPKKWEDKVSVNIYENKASFVADFVTLFDILANTDEGIVLGTVCGDEYTVLSINSFDSGYTDNQELLAMAEDVNIILENLINDYNFVVGVAVEKEDSSTMEIETSVVTMKYPAKWEGIVTANVSEDRVSFVNYGVPLFDLVFTECDGYLLGTYSNTPIYIVEYPANSDEQAAMQEDVNVILQYLLEDPNFIVNM